MTFIFHSIGTKRFAYVSVMREVLITRVEIHSRSKIPSSQIGVCFTCEHEMTFIFHSIGTKRFVYVSVMREVLITRVGIHSRSKIPSSQIGVCFNVNMK